MSLTPEELERQIRQAREKQDPATSGPIRKDTSSSGAGTAMRAGIDLVAAVAVGTFLGYGLDAWLGTKPLCMIVFFFLGFAAGFLNIYRSQTGQDLKIGFKDKK